MIKIKIKPIDIENIKQMVEKYHLNLPNNDLIKRGISYDVYVKINKIDILLPKERTLRLKPQEAVVLLQILQEAEYFAGFVRESAAIGQIIAHLHQQVISYKMSE